MASTCWMPLCSLSWSAQHTRLSSATGSHPSPGRDKSSCGRSASTLPISHRFVPLVLVFASEGRICCPTAASPVGPEAAANATPRCGISRRTDRAAALHAEDRPSALPIMDAANIHLVSRTPMASPRHCEATRTRRERSRAKSAFKPRHAPCGRYHAARRSRHDTRCAGISPQMPLPPYQRQGNSDVTEHLLPQRASSSAHGEFGRPQLRNADLKKSPITLAFSSIDARRHRIHETHTCQCRPDRWGPPNEGIGHRKLATPNQVLHPLSHSFTHTASGRGSRCVDATTRAGSSSHALGAGRSAGGGAHPAKPGPTPSRRPPDSILRSPLHDAPLDNVLKRTLWRKPKEAAGTRRSHGVHDGRTQVVRGETHLQLKEAGHVRTHTHTHEFLANPTGKSRGRSHAWFMISLLCLSRPRNEF